MIALPDQINGAHVDRFTLAHGVVGMVYRGLGLSLPASLGLAIAFELVEGPAKRRWPELFPHPMDDTAANAVVDVAAVVVGWYVGGVLS